MKPPHHPGEINFYEELGVAHDASPEEIRDAFRALARLLHPDQQTDPQLKEIAEEQMRKLNPIYAVLSDPERRRRYDEDLQDGYPPAIILSNAPPRDPRRIFGRIAWIAAITVSAGILIWLASDTAASSGFNPQNRNRVDSLIDPSPGAKDLNNPANASAEIRRLRSDLDSVSAQRDAAVRELDILRGKSARVTAPPERFPAVETRIQTPAPIVAMTELPSASRIPPPAPTYNDPTPAPNAKSEPPRSDGKTPNRRLAGFWFYVRPARGQKNKNQSLYVPEYIEAVITEQSGVVQGKYRSRFQILDSSISPDVNFSFTGTPSGTSLNCAWIGYGGAKGELTLQLVSDNSIRIDWKASELGTQQGLISGTAVLTRRVE